MTDAEDAVQKAAANIPVEVCARFENADKFSNEDRNTIIETARQALARFQPKSEPKAEATPRPEAKAEPEGGPKPDAATQPAAEAKEKS
jgi:F-type H+-transporting ATPase subunit alpha